MKLADVWIAASVIIGFSSTAFAYRIQRELMMREKGYRIWFPPADWLNLAALLILTGGVFVLPAMSLPDSTDFARKALGLGLLLFAGYPFAVIAHYGLHRTENGQDGPAAATSHERWTIAVFGALAVAYVIVGAIR